MNYFLYVKMRLYFFLYNLTLQLTPQLFCIFLYYLKRAKNAETCCNE
jgi:hypothetical protein